jgi:hypothetical protein
MKKTYYLLVVLLILLAGQTEAQFRFTNKNSKLTNSNFNSGCPMAVADWNGDGLDDIIRLDEGHLCYVEVQRTNAQFEQLFIGDFGGNSGWAWGMTVADIDHNGYLDVVAGGNGPSVKIMFTNGINPGTLYSIPSSNFFVQNITCADFNNDGWIDLFVCDDNAQSHVFLNTTTSTFVESSTTINFDVTSTDDSGNYGSVWTDFDNDGDLDLYIAKCRQGVNSPTDGRRINVMFVNDGNGNFTENAAAYNINIGWQSWTASFGDIDNDGDLDLLITNHDFDSQILENNGSGVYTDITPSTGFDITDMTPIQSVMADFDNDGFVDLLITGSEHRIYHNNGNKTFTKMEGMFNGNDMQSFAIGDLNHDGRVDIYAGYATGYTNPSNIDDVIWMNTTHNANHFLAVHLKGTVSNPDAIGARATIYGSWGIQIREVASGEGYGRSNSAILHFGLGASTQIDSMIVWFPSGITQTIINPVADQFIRVVENGCVSPQANISYSRSNLIICTGTTEIATATPGFDYLWTDNSTAATLTIATGGEYNVVITEAGNPCPGISRTLMIEENPDQTPQLIVSGETEFCNGGAVQIDAVEELGLTSYSWSNGQTAASINVSQTGQYSVLVAGYCQLFNSDTIDVVAHVIPDPVSSNVSLTTPGSATLTATGTDLLWYDAPTATVPVATGASYTTPVLNSNTSYWVENSENFNGGIFDGGRLNANGAGYSANGTNAQMFFTVIQNCTLNSVKVYTDLAGTRRIELRNTSGAVLQFADIAMVADSQVVALNFALTPGNYILSTNTAINQAIPTWGNSSPRLQRHNSGSSYPYNIPDALSITGNNFGGQYYYYFYDWKVDVEGLTCYSNRVQVNVSVTVGLQELASAGIELYPNPATDILNVRQQKNQEWNISLFDATGRMVKTVMVQEMSNTLSLSGLAPGIYQVNFRNAEKNVTARIVKQ